MNPDEQLIRDAYAAFNRQDADGALAALHPEVAWADGEGRSLHGHDEVRKHWTEQWATSAPTIEPLAVSRERDGIVTADVRLVVRDAGGEATSERKMKNMFVIQAGLITRMDISD
jgi:ketosteroid isomerase-like protein